MKMNLLTQMTCLSVAMVAVTGCVSRRAIHKNAFLVEAHRSEPAAQSDSQAVLAVQPFSIAPAFQKTGIVSRVGENKYAADYYNEYFVSPAAMITSQTRQWLYDSGLFAQVLSPGSTMLPTHMLDGNVRRMFLDAATDEKPQAVLEITFFLVEKRKREETVVFQKTYTATGSIDSAEPQAYATAQSAGLADILKALETDLAKHL